MTVIIIAPWAGLSLCDQSSQATNWHSAGLHKLEGIGCSLTLSGIWPKKFWWISITRNTNNTNIDLFKPEVLQKVFTELWIQIENFSLKENPVKRNLISSKTFRSDKTITTCFTQLFFVRDMKHLSILKHPIEKLFQRKMEIFYSENVTW